MTLIPLLSGYEPVVYRNPKSAVNVETTFNPWMPGKAGVEVLTVPKS